MSASEWARRAARALTGAGRSPVADDCAAYLSGSYVEHLDRCGVPVPIPPWAWLNAPAHGSRPDIEATLIDPDRLLHRVFFGWRESRSVIGAELLELTEGDDQLLRWLQVDVIEPVEASLFVDGDHTAVATTARVLDAMRSYVAALDSGG